MTERIEKGIRIGIVGRNLTFSVSEDGGVNVRWNRSGEANKHFYWGAYKQKWGAAEYNIEEIKVPIPFSRNTSDGKSWIGKPSKNVTRDWFLVTEDYGPICGLTGNMTPVVNNNVVEFTESSNDIEITSASTLAFMVRVKNQYDIFLKPIVEVETTIEKGTLYAIFRTGDVGIVRS